MKLWTSVSAALLLALLGTAAHAQILIGQSAGFKDGLNNSSPRAVASR